MSRKALLVLTAGIVAIAVPAGAGAVYSLFDFQSATDALIAIDPTIDAPPNDRNRNFAVGGFQGQDNNNVGFSAHSDPLGFDPEGKLSETIPFELPTETPSTYQGRFRVTCLAVALNEAALGLVPTEAASNDQPGEFVLAVRDNHLLGLVDEYGILPIPADDCAFGLGFAGLPIARGDILVNDALP
jgi:hypothetical protein